MNLEEGPTVRRLCKPVEGVGNRVEGARFRLTQHHPCCHPKRDRETSLDPQELTPSSAVNDRTAVYEGEQGKTFIAYDGFSSLLSQYNRVEIAPIAKLVEQKLEELVAEATGEPRADI
jgi:hypothetical protein